MRSSPSPAKQSTTSSTCLTSVPERLHVIYDGIDLEEYKRVDSRAALKRFAINPLEPYVLFVGRITRQKGIIHLVNAIKYPWILASESFCAQALRTPRKSGLK